MEDSSADPAEIDAYSYDVLYILYHSNDGWYMFCYKELKAC